MQIKLNIRNGKAVAKHLDRQLANVVGGVTKAKVKLVRQTLEAIADLLPVWSGKTQNSITVREGARGNPHKQAWDRRSDYGHTNDLPVGVGAEPMANRQRITGQINKVKPAAQAATAEEAIKRASGQIWIVSASPATDAGVWEGRAPRRNLARSNSSMVVEIVMRGSRGTTFARK